MDLTVTEESLPPCLHRQETCSDPNGSVLGTSLPVGPAQLILEFGAISEVTTAPCRFYSLSHPLIPVLCIISEGVQARR